MDDEASGVVIESAKELMELIRGIEPKWRNAYFRFVCDPTHYGAEGSYTSDSRVTLVDAITHARFFRSMKGKGKKQSARCWMGSLTFLPLESFRSPPLRGTQLERN